MPDKQPNYPTLSNSLLVDEVANVVYAWRHGTMNNYEALKKIERSVRELREDLYV